MEPGGVEEGSEGDYSWGMNFEARLCRDCGAEYVTVKVLQRYCSGKCAMRAYWRRRLVREGVVTGGGVMEDAAAQVAGPAEVVLEALVDK